jgi:hypothetical protein
VAEEIVSVLNKHAELFWTRFGDLAAVLTQLDAGERPPFVGPEHLIVAALLTRAGRQSQAEELLEKELDSTPSPELVRIIAGRLGLILAA